MDGTGEEILHNSSLSAPYSLALDYASQSLYWADYDLDKIEKSSTNGSNRQLVTTSLVNDVYSMTFFDGKLYWTDLTDDKIFTASTTAPNSTIPFSNLLGDMYGIQVVAREQQPQGSFYSYLGASLCMPQ